MALRLEIISDQRHQLGARSQHRAGRLRAAASVVRLTMTGSCRTPSATCPPTMPASSSARVASTWKTPAPMASSSTIPPAAGAPRPVRAARAVTCCAGRLPHPRHIESDDALPPPGNQHALADGGRTASMPLRAVGRRADDLGASLNIEALIPGHGRRCRRSRARLKQAGERPQLSAQQRLSAPARCGTRATGRHSHRAGRCAQWHCRHSAGAPASTLRACPWTAKRNSLHLAGQLLREALHRPQGSAARTAGVPRPLRHRDRSG